MKLTSPFSRGRIVGLAISIALTFAALDSQVVAQQSVSRIDREFIRETVESLASVVNREYFDAGVGARVDASLRQWLSQRRYADAETLESLAGILRALRAEYAAGHLRTIEQLIHADVFADFLEMAQ